MHLRQTAINGMCALAVLIIAAGSADAQAGRETFKATATVKTASGGDDNGSGHDYGRPEDVGARSGRLEGRLHSRRSGGAAESARRGFLRRDRYSSVVGHQRPHG